jgi:uncharacterized protein YjfI (DUF2170 family)
MSTMNTQDLTLHLALRLTDLRAFEGYEFDCQPIPGEVDVLQITVGDFEEMPIFLSVTDSQILCVSHLFTDAEVIADKRSRMMEEMLELNIAMPLSSFAKIGERFVVFGALSVHSSIEDICHELITLAENGAEALVALEEFIR